jgi:hypothetical protein|tara:strand:+ start:100 stop:450 length:351 start_codon:yes stop_codon:yes gene_type:complete
MPQTEYQKKWVKANPEKVALYKQRYKEKHGKNIAKKRSLEYFANKPKHQELNKKYYAENEELIKAQKRVYYIKNKEIIKAKANKNYYKKKYESLKNGPEEKGTILDFVVKVEEINK